ncbi:hypothetical protein C8R45DRAFT_1071297 [Mycena sanguinolenta]|nr:hypothetical protein C8R45DRAFT_1071297 [Mycena sanguinolenta]
MQNDIQGASDTSHDAVASVLSRLFSAGASQEFFQPHSYWVRLWKTMEFQSYTAPEFTQTAGTTRSDRMQSWSLIGDWTVNYCNTNTVEHIRKLTGTQWDYFHALLGVYRTPGTTMSLRMHPSTGRGGRGNFETHRRDRVEATILTSESGEGGFASADAENNHRPLSGTFPSACKPKKKRQHENLCRIAPTFVSSFLTSALEAVGIDPVSAAVEKPNNDVKMMDIMIGHSSPTYGWFLVSLVSQFTVTWYY